MRLNRHHLQWILWMLVYLGFQRVLADEVTVFAAVSLAESLRELATLHEARTSDRVTFNFGASSLLARQLTEGAPGDVFFSADEAKMDGLEKAGKIVSNTRITRLSNQLVIITPKNSTALLSSPQELTNRVVERIALADPKSVPAGIYAKIYLGRLNLWKAVEPKVVPTENVRAALAAVESGEVDAGIVYKSDVTVSRKVQIAYEVPWKDFSEIRYPVALVSGSAHEVAARKFMAFLSTETAAAVFRRHGFRVLE